jgi:UDP-N-acetylglucosamine 2-epimerase (non-hydrolysing)
MKTVLFIFGTRPEAIKLAPVIKIFTKNNDLFTTRVCVTAQHREMLDQVLEFFEIQPDYDLNLMLRHQDLFDITSNCLTGLKDIFEICHPDLVFVQGDTTTALSAALSAFYFKIKIAHIEAGLRTFDKLSPYPEEINRKLISSLADYHFTPTPTARRNLLNENISKGVYQVGNTVIDSLFLGLDIIKKSKLFISNPVLKDIDFSKKIILITGHRRENFGTPFQNVCFAIKHLAEKFPDVEFIYPVHLNPNVMIPVHSILNSEKNIHLLSPLNYPDLIMLMNKSYLILTDSGGIQEEAPSLKIPVLVMREVTERFEGIEAGNARIVGTNKKKIISEVTNLLVNKDDYKSMQKNNNPYGDGKSAGKIFDIIKDVLLNQ